MQIRLVASADYVRYMCLVCVATNFEADVVRYIQGIYYTHVKNIDIS